MCDVKKFIVVVCVIVLLVLCVPIPIGPYESGTRTYSALLYKVVVWHSNSLWMDKNGKPVEGIPDGTVGIYFFPNNMKKLQELERIEVTKHK